MTDTTESTQEAGPELDARIAVEVMGWKLGKRTVGGYANKREYACWKDGKRPPWDVDQWAPSRDIEQAMMVVAALENDPRQILFSLVRRATHGSDEGRPDDKVWAVEFRQCTPPFPKYATATAATLSHAICLAALNAVEHEGHSEEMK